MSIEDISTGRVKASQLERGASRRPARLAALGVASLMAAMLMCAPQTAIAAEIDTSVHLFGSNGATSADVSGGRVVWAAPGGSDGGKDFEIYSWTLESGVEQITSNDWDDIDPILSSDRVAWKGKGPDGSDWEIFTWDAHSGVPVQLTDNALEDGEYDVSEAAVVWITSQTPSTTSLHLWTEVAWPWLGTHWENITVSGGPTRYSTPKLADRQVVFLADGGSDGGTDAEVFRWYDPEIGALQYTQNDLEEIEVAVDGNHTAWVGNWLTADSWAVFSSRMPGTFVWGETDEVPNSLDISGDRIVFHTDPNPAYTTSRYEAIRFAPVDSNPNHIARLLNETATPLSAPRIDGERVVWARSDLRGDTIRTWRDHYGVSDVASNRGYLVSGPRISGDQIVWVADDGVYLAPNPILFPLRGTGSHQDRFDLVFIPDEDYGRPADIDTWLPVFLGDVARKIDNQLGGKFPVEGNLSRFNFYYSTVQGDDEPGTDTTWPKHDIPDDVKRRTPFADAYVILHNETYYDSCLYSNPPRYGAEGPIDNGSFIHESGHGVFGLSDEYDDQFPPITYYFQPFPYPNIWKTRAAAEADAAAEGWSEGIVRFHEPVGSEGAWYKLGEANYIMGYPEDFEAGWGKPAERRIQWVLDNFSAASGGSTSSGESGESVRLELRVEDGEFSVLSDDKADGAPPNYLPGDYAFDAEVYAANGELLGDYGIRDPRVVLAEPGYVGPTWLDTTDFSIVVPALEDATRLDLVETETGDVVASADITEHDNLPPVADAGGPYSSGEGGPVALDGSASYDPDGDALTYSWDFDGDGIEDSDEVSRAHGWPDDLGNGDPDRF